MYGLFNCENSSVLQEKMRSLKKTEFQIKKDDKHIGEVKRITTTNVLCRKVKKMKV